MLDDKKIAFNICYNNELYLAECTGYINELRIPQGYTVDIYSVYGADSMASAYNTMMNSSNAKYKIYLHQDVFIFYKDFLETVTKIFAENEDAGMLGVVGGVNVPENAIAWNAWNKGCTLGYNGSGIVKVSFPAGEEKAYTEVEAIDGMLMITQYDIPWREDLNLGWDFYDISQSLEFRRKGYKIGIPNIDKAWCMHDCGLSKMKNYDRSRRIVLSEYDDFFCGEFHEAYNQELYILQEKVADKIKWCIANGYMKEALEINGKLKNMRIYDNDILLSKILLEIYEQEQLAFDLKDSFFTDINTWDDVLRKYTRIKFGIMRTEHAPESMETEKLIDIVKSGAISIEALSVILCHCALEPQKVIDAFV